MIAFLREDWRLESLRRCSQRLTKRELHTTLVVSPVAYSLISLLVGPLVRSRRARSGFPQLLSRDQA